MSTAPPAPGRTEDVAIHGISSQGAGVGTLSDGRTVFVPRTAPGDLVRVRLERVRPRWATGALVEVLEPSQERRSGLCPVYGRCGGCQLQHVSEDVQRRLKGELVVEALDRIGGLGRIDPPRVEPSPEATRYRSRMSFTLRRLPGGRVVAGLHALGRPGHVLDVHDECVLPEPAVAELWVRLRERWGENAKLLPAGGRLRLTLRSTSAGVTLLVEGGAVDWDDTPLRRAVPELVEVLHRPKGVRLGGVSPTEPVEEDEDTEADPIVGAFEQVNRGAGELLRAHVVARAGEGRTAVDAYCGTGPFGRALAEKGWTVVGLELDPEATAAAAAGAPEGFSVRTGAVERLLPVVLPADLLIVNPPRTGLAPEVMTQILAEPPTRLIYVSCDPATLARDLGRLGDRYVLEDVHAFDLFPQTAHVETVVVLGPAPHLQNLESVS